MLQIYFKYLPISDTDKTYRNIYLTNTAYKKSFNLLILSYVHLGGDHPLIIWVPFVV